MIFNIDNIFQQAFAAHQNGKIEEAADGYIKILSSVPDHPNALHLLGLIEFDRKNYVSAIPLVKKSLELVPNALQWLLNYGKIMATVARYESAIAAYQQAISVDPCCIAAGEALGDLYYDLGEFGEAQKIYYEFLRDNPTDLVLCIKYGNNLKEMGNLEEAKVFLNGLAGRFSGNTELYISLAEVYMVLRNYNDAIRYYENANSLSPGCLPYAFSKLKRFFRSIGEVDEYFEQITGWVNYLWNLVFQKMIGDKHVPVIDAFLKNHNLLLFFNTNNLKEVYSQWGDLIEWLMRRESNELDFKFTNKNCKKIRVGFLSSNYNDRTETYVAIPAFEHLNHDKYEVVLYQLNHFNNSWIEFCRQRTDKFVELTDLTMAEQAATIRSDDLDLLIIVDNVTCYCSHVTMLSTHRLARKQVCLQTSPCTTGIKNMDAYISGTEVLIKNPEDFYRERFIPLKGSGCCFNFLDSMNFNKIDLRAIRNHLGIPYDGIVFVSGANFNKLLPELDEIWANILAKVPNSFLLLYPYNPNWLSSYPLTIEWRIRKVLSRFEIEPERVMFLNSTRDLSKLDIINVLLSSDIYLDAISYSGNISIAEALIAGLPTLVFKSGPYHKNRSAAALLKEIGLDDLIAANESAYVDIAVRLGKSKAMRDDFRKRIGKEMAKAPFLDACHYGKMMEDVFEKLCSDI